MAFNVVCSAILVLLGSPLRIYIISNGGYLLSCSLALAGYFVYRHLRPDEPRPFRLPTFAKWGALLVFVVWMVIYFFGGWNSPKIVLNDPHQGPGLYLLGLLIVALYAPLYWWRAWQDRGWPPPRLPGPRRPLAAGRGRSGLPVVGYFPPRGITDQAGGEPSAGEPPGVPVGRRHAVRAAALGPPADDPRGGAARLPGDAVQQRGHPPRARARGRPAGRGADDPEGLRLVLRAAEPRPAAHPARARRAVRDRAAGHQRLERRGCTADGQIAATRSAGRTIAKVARRRQVRYVVMDDSAPSGVRRVTEGTVTATVRRRLVAEQARAGRPGARIS